MPPLPDIILVGGLPRHGKSTAATQLSTFTGRPWADCSQVIYEKVAEAKGVDIATLRAMDKRLIREDLIRMGDELCLADPAYLAHAMIERGNTIIAGVRKPDEVKILCEEYHAVLIWVEALDEDQKAQALLLDPEADPASVHAAPTIHDNTDLQIRAMADAVIFNMTYPQLTDDLRYITVKLGLIPTHWDIKPRKRD